MHITHFPNIGQAEDNVALIVVIELLPTRCTRTLLS